MRSRIVYLVILAAFVRQLSADELTRCVQEELRRRHLYFGEIDGRTNAELQGALRRYQTRKNLGATGEITQETAQSLNVPLAVTKAVEHWPDTPVLKSDVAREPPESPPRQFEKMSIQRAVTTESPPPPPAESPTGLQNISPEQVTKFVERYLRDAEGEDVDLQVGYYASPVEYFDHGAVDRPFVTRDTRAYIKRWPERHYRLSGPVSVQAAAAGDELRVEFTIEFSVGNAKTRAHGRTRNFWTLRAEKRSLQIARIQEQRLRD